jgi:sugar-phosphatase
MNSSSPQILCQGILFDMDNVLVSSQGAVERTWTKWARMRGLDPEPVIRAGHGCRSLETIAIVAPHLDAAAEAEIVETIEAADTEGLTMLPAVIELLSALPPHRWTVVTSATVPLARARLTAAGVPIPARIVTAECAPLGKPHPGPYLAGAALLGFKLTECVVFEDAPSGVASGRAAGCTVVATTYSVPAEELAAAHYRITDLIAVSLKVLPDGLELTLTALAG